MYLFYFSYLQCPVESSLLNQKTFRCGHNTLVLVSWPGQESIILSNGFLDLSANLLICYDFCANCPIVLGRISPQRSWLFSITVWTNPPTPAMYLPGVGCSKLTTSLVNVSLKFQMLRAILWEHQKILETHSHRFEWIYGIWIEGQKVSIESGISFSKCPLVSIATSLEVMKIVIFKKTDKVWLSINNKSDMRLFQNFVVVFWDYIFLLSTSIKNLQVIAGLAFL